MPKNPGWPFFKFLIKGNFLSNQIKMVWKSNILKRSRESESIIENEWERFLASGVKSRLDDLKPSRPHFGGAKIKNGKLIIKADPIISYRDAIGGRSPKLHKMKKGFIPIPLGVVVAIISKTETGEEKLGIAIRNQKHDYKPGGYSVTAGGYMDIKTKETPIKTAIRELKEETGLKLKEVKRLVCRGITYNIGSSTAGVIFFAQTDLTPSAIAAKLHDDENKIVFIPIKEKFLENFVLETAPAATEDTLAAILILGKDYYGENWYKKMLKLLPKIGAPPGNQAKCNAMEKKAVQKLKKIIHHKKTRLRNGPMLLPTKEMN